MKITLLNELLRWYSLNYEKELSGRRILFKDIEPLMDRLSAQFRKELIGYSENNIPIYKIGIGTGSEKILCWSQMHGNECTGTKSLFDLFRFFADDDQFRDVSNTILKNCTLEFIVLLNPDGAINFTRENAHHIDLNRDAVDKKAVESRLLRAVLDGFKPHFCFNLHDQRSIFNVKGTKNPATLSFLAPSENVERSLTEGRKETMKVIVAMNDALQKLIPNQVGRYTDEFYPTATGDNFQKLGYNTILFEAGHYLDDYDREITRKYNFIAILSGLYCIASGLMHPNYSDYFEIPNNDELFLDKIYKNILISDNIIYKRADVGVQIKFKISEGILLKYECIEKIGDLSKYHSNNIINAEKMNYENLKLSNS